MLDLELVSGPTGSALDIVPLAEFKKHLRITNNSLDDDLEACLNEAVDKLGGRDGELNRTIFRTTWRRHFSCFPARSGVLRLPFPPLISVDGITYDDGESPLSEIDMDDVVVRVRDLIPEIRLIDTNTGWPSLGSYTHPRAVSVTYTAGYTTYPHQLKRMVKILAAHYFENGEATINETKTIMINRAVMFGMEDLRASLKIPNSHDDWA